MGGLADSLEGVSGHANKEVREWGQRPTKKGNKPGCAPDSPIARL